MDLLTDYRGLVVGIANQRSLAYGIARAASEQGAKLVLGYQNERLLRRLLPIGEELSADALVKCDLSLDNEIIQLGKKIEELWGQLDFVVHAVAHAQVEDLTGRFLDTSRENFLSAMSVSVYSLVELVRVLEPLLKKSDKNPSILTLTYLGSERAMPNYNVMGVAKAALESSVRYLANELGPLGIRVNALSAGPIKTLSAAGVKGLRSMLGVVASQSPLRRNVNISDIGRAALFTLSDLSQAMTGEVIYIDSGYHILGTYGAVE